MDDERTTVVVRARVCADFVAVSKCLFSWGKKEREKKDRDGGTGLDVSSHAVISP